MATDAGLVFVDEGDDGDDLGHLLAGDELGDIGFFADALALLTEFEVAPDLREPTTGGIGEIKGVGVKTRLDRAADADAEILGELEKTGAAQVGSVQVPNDDVRGRLGRR